MHILLEYIIRLNRVKIPFFLGSELEQVKHKILLLRNMVVLYVVNSVLPECENFPDNQTNYGLKESQKLNLNSRR